MIFITVSWLTEVDLQHVGTAVLPPHFEAWIESPRKTHVVAPRQVLVVITASTPPPDGGAKLPNTKVFRPDFGWQWIFRLPGHDQETLPDRRINLVWPMKHLTMVTVAGKYGSRRQHGRRMWRIMHHPSLGALSFF